MYVVTENTPGYLPDADEPAEFEDFASALSYAREEAERLVEHHHEGMETEDEFKVTVSETVMEDYARIDVDTDRPHDLGRVIEVTQSGVGYVLGFWYP